MNLPINKNRAWITRLHESIDRLDASTKLTVMKAAGIACASDLMSLIEQYTGKRASSVAELVAGWNIVRDKRGLKGGWKLEGNIVRGVFNECGCPLVRSGLIELHPVQCYCSQGLMETIFSEAAGKPVEAQIRRSIGRGDEICDFLITL